MSSTFAKLIFASEPMTIGKHEWRIVVYPNPNIRLDTELSERLGLQPSPAFTDFQFRMAEVGRFASAVRMDNEAGLNRWQSMKEWPSYNSNDGTYAGCPKSLTKLYEANRAAVKEALAI